MKRQKKTEIENKKKVIQTKTRKGRVEAIKKNNYMPSVKINLILISFISVLTFIVYYPSFDNELTNWDDDQYILENPYLKEINSENFEKMFLDKETYYYMGNYHPLAMLSLSIDYKISGQSDEEDINPFIFHLTNLTLHILVSLSVYFFVLLLFNNYIIAFIAGLLFGVHTLHVESVTWVSERKDVLYSFFFVTSLISYVSYIKKEKAVFYIIALILFFLSLLSKGQAVSLAITLIAIDYFFKRNLISVKVIVEKIPFIALALFFGLLAVWAQQKGGAMVEDSEYGLIKRIAIASYAFMQYVIKLVLPIELSAINPYPNLVEKTLTPIYWASIVPALAVAFLLVWFYLKEKKVLTFSIAFFVINIILLLQFIPVGSAVYSDRYAYIPSLGFYILVAYLINKFAEKQTSRKPLIYGALGIYIMLLFVLTWQRNDVWQNSLTLWDDTIEKSPTAVVALNNRGSTKDRMSQAIVDSNVIMTDIQKDSVIRLRKEAVNDFTVAIMYKPDYKSAFFNRGSSRYELFKLTGEKDLLDSAIEDYTKAIKFSQNNKEQLFDDAFHQRANVYSDKGEYEKAFQDFDIAVSIAPEKPMYYVNRGVTKGKYADFLRNTSDQFKYMSENAKAEGKFEQAKDFYKNYEEYLNKSLEVMKSSLEDFNKAFETGDVEKEANLYSNRGLAKYGLGMYEEAVKDYTKSLEIDKNFTSAISNRCMSYYALKQYDKVLEDADKLIEIGKKEHLAQAYYFKALVYYNTKNKDKACENFKFAAEQGHKNAEAFYKKFCGAN